MRNERIPLYGTPFIHVEDYFANIKFFSLGSNKYAPGIALVDSSGNIVNPIGTPSAVTSGRKAITNAGTAERLVTSSTPCKYVMVCAALGNTNPVAVGGSGVIAANGATQTGTILIPGNDPIRIDIDDVNKLFGDVQTSGEAIVFSYFV